MFVSIRGRSWGVATRACSVTTACCHCFAPSAMTELEMYIGQGKWNILYHIGYPSDTTRGECAIFAFKSLGISKAFARQSYCLYVILKHLQVLASVSKPFARILNAFSRKCKNNRNPFALFVMDSQKFAGFVRISQAFMRPHFFHYFSRPILSFSANLPRIPNFHIRRDILHGMR